MTPTVTVRPLTPQPTLVIRRKIAMTDIAQTLGEILPKIFVYAQTKGIAMASPPFARYLTMGPGLITLEGGLAIAGSAQGDGEIEVSELPGGSAAVATHEGAYDTLQATHVVVEQWIDAEKRKPSGAPWELYVTDPGETPDPKDWRTEVFYPLAR